MWKNPLVRMHFAAVLYGLSGIFGALVSARADTIVLGRAAFAWVLISALFLITRQKPWQNVSRKSAGYLAIAGVLLAIHWLTFFLAVQWGGVAIGTLGFSCFPAATAICEAIFFKEKLRRSEWLLLLVIVLGLVLITPSFTWGNQATAGLLLGILSGSVYGFLAVYYRMVQVDNISSMQMCWWQYLAISLLMLPITGPVMANISQSDWFWIACVGVFCTFWAYHLFLTSLQVLKARVVAMIIALEPVYAILVAWAFLGQSPSLRMVLGGALIIWAVLMSSRR